MHRRNFVAITLCLISTGLLSAQRAVTPIEVTPEKIRQMEQAISTKMSALSIPGISVAVGVGKDIKWTAAYGMSDLENMVPMKTSTVVRLGSIAKPITAVAAMQLVEHGKLDLDAEVQRYVPSFPVKQWPLKVRHLLTHQGGVRHYQGDEIQSTKLYSTVKAGLEIFDKDPLLFEPGSKYSYTTYGFNLLGAIVEAASGMSYTDYVREKIFKPARMAGIDVDETYRIIPNRSRGYRLNSDKVLTNCGLADTSYKIPGGGFVSRAEDLIKFVASIQTGILMKRETMNAMFTPQKFKDGNISGWGLGWSTDTFEGRKRVGHSGGQQGITTHLTYFPAEGLSIAVLANLEQTRIGDFSGALAKILLTQD
jgi:CubicO group peptidase (beta-lactamase class C family)